MPELRWILLILGLATVVGIYWWGRRRAMPRDQSAAATRVEPRLAEDERWSSAGDGGHAASAAQVYAGQHERNIESDDSQRILALHIRAPAGDSLPGAELGQAFAAEGLEFGQFDAFHLQADSGRTVFTVVSMVEPGTFPADRMDEFSTPGLTMFMLLADSDGVASLSKMVACARRLASRLGAEVLDQDGSTFTNQRAAHMKEQIVEYLRQARLGSGLTD